MSPNEVKELVRLITNKRFFDLPEKRFFEVYIAQRSEELEFHRITIHDGVAKAGRVFVVGEYAGEMESLPSDFWAIEKEIVRIKNYKFPPSAKACSPPATIN